jgi:hypothetical protein
MAEEIYQECLELELGLRGIVFVLKTGHKGALEWKRLILSEVIGNSDAGNADLR